MGRMATARSNFVVHKTTTRPASHGDASAAAAAGLGRRSRSHGREPRLPAEARRGGGHRRPAQRATVQANQIWASGGPEARARNTVCGALHREADLRPDLRLLPLLFLRVPSDVRAVRGDRGLDRGDAADARGGQVAARARARAMHPVHAAQG